MGARIVRLGDGPTRWCRQKGPCGSRPLHGPQGRIGCACLNYWHTIANSYFTYLSLLYSCHSPRYTATAGMGDSSMMARVGSQRIIALRMAGGAVLFLAAAAALGAALIHVCGWKLLLAAYLLCELCFVPYYFMRAAQLNKQPQPHKPAGLDGAANSARYMHIRQYFKFCDKYLSPWFRGAPMEDILEENVLDLLAYGCYYSNIKELRAAGEDKVITNMLRQLVQETGLVFKKGFNPDPRIMAHIWEDLRHVFRPLLFYLIMEVVAGLTAAMLLAAGFECYSRSGFTYYCKGVAAAAQEMPILFLHGVGAGHFPYVTFVAKLAAEGRPLIMPVYPHVSMRLCSRIPTTQELVDSTAAFLSSCGVTRVDLVSHSYGTLVGSGLLRCHPQLAATCTMVDPVCFAMFMPTLLKSFLYSYPSTGNFIMDFAMWMVSRELHCCASFSRGFYWSEVNMWADNIPENMLVLLGGRDVLSASHQIKDWLEEATSAQVLFKEDMPHAGFLLDLNCQDMIMDVWRNHTHSCSTLAQPATAAAAADATAVAAQPALPAAVDAEVVRKPDQQQQKEVQHFRGESLPQKHFRDDSLSHQHFRDESLPQQHFREIPLPQQQRRAERPVTAAATSAPSAALSPVSSSAFTHLQLPHLSKRPNPFLNSHANLVAAASGISAAAEAVHNWAPPSGMQYSVPAVSTRVGRDQHHAKLLQQGSAAAQQLLGMCSAVHGSMSGSATSMSRGGSSNAEQQLDDIGELDQLYQPGAGRATLRRRPAMHAMHAALSAAPPSLLASAPSNKSALAMTCSVDLGALSHLGALQPLA